MKQAVKVVEEIERLRRAIEKTQSARLKKDYSKAIRRLTAELKEYCGYKKLNINEVMRGAQKCKLNTGKYGD